jgi:hypothetical protein
MCRSEEILDSDTLNLNAIPADGCWIRPSWRPTGGANSVDESGLYGDLNRMSCGGWGSTTAGGGLILSGSNALPSNPGIVPIGTFRTADCSEARSVACCKPTPVPSPTSSLMLPIGVSGLAALSLIKNAS